MFFKEQAYYAEICGALNTQYAFVVRKLILMAYGHTEGGLTKRLYPLGPLALECVCVIYRLAMVSHKLCRLLLYRELL